MRNSKNKSVSQGKSLAVPELQLNLLGGFELRADNAVISALPKKVRGLLAYLAMTGTRMQARETLAALLWPDSSDAQARMSLRSALAALRQSLGYNFQRVVVCDNENVGLAYEQLSTDVRKMEALAADGNIEALKAAFNLYTGDFLLGLRVGGSAFGQWCETERTRLSALTVNTGVRLLTALHSQHNFEEALTVGHRVLALDPLREDVHRTLMRLHTDQAHPALALKQYHLCRAVLAQELGVAPEIETERLHQSIVQQRRPETPHAGYRLRSDIEEEAPRAKSGGEAYESLASFLSHDQIETSVDNSGTAMNEDVASVAVPAFVGRREILRHLLGLLDISVSANAGHTVLVRGEAGIGKTRLGAKLVELSSKRQIASHIVRLLDFGGAAYRDPLSQLTQSLFGLVKETPAAH